MKKLLWSIFVLIILLIFIGLASCIETGDDERPGMAISTDLLLTKVWEVDLFQDDGQNKSSLFHNVFLEFRPNFLFKITHGCDIINGEWILSSDSTLLVIRLPDSPEPLNQLEDEWVVTWLTDKEMHLIEQDDKGDEEFHLKVTPLSSLNCSSCEQYNNILTDNVWSILSFTTPGKEYTEQSRGSYLDFKQSGEVILHSGDDELAGSWVLTDQCHTLVIQWFADYLHYETYQILQDHWFIQDIDSKIIFLETGDEDQLHLSKGKLPDCSEVHTNMLNTSWSIDVVSINEDNVSDNFIGTGFTFLENNQLASEVFIGPAVLGEWMITGSCDLLSLQIQAGQLKELSREWTIVEMRQDRIILVHEEGTLRMEMQLIQGKPQPSANCVKFINEILEKKWSVVKLEENGNTADNNLAGYYLRFNEVGELLIWNNQNELKGNWYPVRDCNYILLEVDREGFAGKLAGKWKIENIENNKLILVYEKMDLRKTIELVST